MAFIAYLIKIMPDYAWVLNIQKHDGNTAEDVTRAETILHKHITAHLKDLGIDPVAQSSDTKKHTADAKQEAQFNVATLLYAHIDPQYHYIFDGTRTTTNDAATKIWISMHKWWANVSRAKHAHSLVQGITSIQSSPATLDAVLKTLPQLLDTANEIGTISMDAGEMFTLLYCTHIIRQQSCEPALAALAREFIDNPDIKLRTLADKLHHLRETLGTTTNRTNTGPRRPLNAPRSRATTDLEGRHINASGLTCCNKCLKPCSGDHRETTCRMGAPPGTPPAQITSRQTQPHQQQQQQQPPARPPPARSVPAHLTTASADGHRWGPGWVNYDTGEGLPYAEYSVNTDNAYIPTPRLIHTLTASDTPPSHTQPEHPHNSPSHLPCIDSAAGKSVTNDSHNISNPRPCPLLVRSSSGHTSRNNLQGTWHIHTTDEHSSPVTLQIPNTILSPGTKASLMSLHHLLTLGYTFHPHTQDQSWLTTPTGTRIPLLLNHGLWYLPPPPTTSHTTNTFHTPTTLGGRFHALLSHSNPEEEPTEPTEAQPPSSTPPRAPSPQQKAMTLHRAHAHPYNGKLILALQRRNELSPDLLSALRSLRCSDCAMMKAHRQPTPSNKPRRGIRFLLRPDTQTDTSVQDNPPTISQDQYVSNTHATKSPLAPQPATTLPPSPSPRGPGPNGSGPPPGQTPEDPGGPGDPATTPPISGTVLQARPISQAPSKYRPGEFIHIDSTGKYDFDTPTHDGSTHAFLFTDDTSSARFGFPSKDKTSKTLVTLLQRFQAHSGIPLRRIQTDEEFLTAELQEYCLNQPTPILLHASPAFEHESNGRAEATVHHGKATARVLSQTAGAGPHLFPYALDYGLTQNNDLPSDANPNKLSPMDIWPDMPFQHTRLSRPPFGCRCFLHEGKEHGQNNTKGYRARPLIFIGYHHDTASYLAYDIDSSGSLHHGTHMTFHPDIFPLKDMLLAGEAFPSDQAINIHGWRAAAPLLITEASDLELATFCGGKQILLPLPPSYWPTFDPHFWTVTCRRPIQHRNGLTSIETTPTAFSGPPDDIPNKWRNFKTKPFLETYPVSPPHTNSSQQDRSLRTALQKAYPTARTLSDLASLSATKAGALPLHPAVAQPPPAPTTPNQGEHKPPPTLHTNRPKHTHPPLRSSPRIKIIPVAARHTSTHRITRVKRCPPRTGSHFIRSYTVGFEPSNQRSAQRHTTWPLWQAAEQREIQGILDRGTIERVPRSSLPPNAQILPTMFTYKDKDTGPKARLVILGNKLRNKPSCSDTFASTPHPAAVRTLFALAAQSGHDVHQLDISQAFCQSDDLPSHLRAYIRPPPEYEPDPNTVWKLIKPLYGLSIAPKAWQGTLRSYLTSTGWTSVGFEDTFYTRSTGTTTMHLIYHVDDILLSFDDKDTLAAETFKSDLLTRFAGLDLGPVKRYLGVDIHRNSDGSIHLCQERLIKDLLDRHLPPDSNPAKTPMDHNKPLDQAPTPPTLNRDIYQKYNEVVGSLRYLCEWTRADLAFSSHVLARHLSNPGPDHWDAAIRTLRYLKGTASLTLKFSPQSDPSLRNTLVGFADADYAAHKQTRKSITAWTFFLNGGAISWRSKLQPSVAVSTSEAEFVSASKAALEAVWLRRILADLGTPQTQPTPLYEDNHACILMSENPVHRERTKHIDIRVHSLRENVQLGNVRLVPCPTVDMTADALTKALPAPAFIKHRQTILGHSPFTAPPFPHDLTVPAHLTIIHEPTYFVPCFQWLEAQLLY